MIIVTVPMGPTSPLFLLRHGPTADTRAGWLSGRRDPPCDPDPPSVDLGPLLGALAPSAQILVVSSPQRRALDTARAVAAALRARPDAPTVRVVICAALRERAFGTLEGAAKDTLVLGADLRYRRREPGPVRDRGQESVTSVCARVRRALNAIGALQRATPTPHATLVVSHSHTLRCFTAELLGLTSQECWPLVRFAPGIVQAADALGRRCRALLASRVASSTRPDASPPRHP